MALIAHWPLNGDTSDYSGNGYHLENNGCTISNEGKIGKCYEIQGRTKYFSIPLTFNTQLNKNNFAISFWIKNLNEPIENDNRSIGLFGPISGTRNLNFYAYSKSTDFHWSCSGLGNGIITNCLTLNNWVFVIVKIIDNNIKIYINNELKVNNNKTNNLIIPLDIKYQIGTNDITGSSIKYLINDIKIFNHELSKKEIQELYQTKILDWKFNECEEPTINLIPFSSNFNDFELNSLAGFTSQLNGEGNYIKIVKNEKFINGTNSLKILGTNRAYRTINLKANKIYTLSAEIYSDYKLQILEPELHGGEYSWSRPYIRNNIHLGNGWQKLYITTEPLKNDCTLYIMIYSNSLTKPIYIDNLQLEEKEYSTEFTSNERKGIINDSSGYRNHGLIELNSSPKWINNNGEYSYEFNGTNNFILLKNPKCKINDEFTLNINAYSNNWQDTKSKRLISCTEGSGWNIEINVPINYISFSVNRNGTYYSNRILLSELPKSGNLDFTCVTNKTKQILYINGIKKNEIQTINENIKYINNSIFIGAEAGTSDINPASGNFFDGKINKIKIFTNTLSDKEIKELYENQLTIDKNNNINCFEVNKKNNNNSLIDKNGNLFKNINEINLTNLFEYKIINNKKYGLIFYHNCKDGNVLFDSNKENFLLINEENKKSKLKYLEEFRENNKFEFLLEYQDLPNQYNNWYQTSNPTLNQSIIGYEEIRCDWKYSSWNGIAFSTEQSMTWIDGSPGISTWYYAIGAKCKHILGIPTGNASTANWVKLWVKIPELENNNFVKINKNNEILCNEISEV